MTRKNYLKKTVLFWGVLLAPILFLKFMLFLFNDSGTDLSQFQARINIYMMTIILLPMGGLFFKEDHVRQICYRIQRFCIILVFILLAGLYIYFQLLYL